MFVKFEPKNGKAVIGDTTDSQHTNWLDVQDTAFGVSAPMDAKSGRPAGKRAHQPISVNLRVDRATPELIQYCIRHLPFKKITFKFFRVTQDSTDGKGAGAQGTQTAAAGEEECYYTVTLLDSYIVDATLDPIPGQSFDYLTVTIQFRQIEYRHEKGTSANDNLDETIKGSKVIGQLEAHG